MPEVISARAESRMRSRSSGKVQRTSPSTRASKSGNRRAASSTNSQMVVHGASDMAATLIHCFGHFGVGRSVSGLDCSLSDEIGDFVVAETQIVGQYRAGVLA